MSMPTLYLYLVYTRVALATHNISNTASNYCMFQQSTWLMVIDNCLKRLLSSSLFSFTVFENSSVVFATCLLNEQGNRI
jgi:hypothetical protein